MTTPMCEEWESAQDDGKVAYRTDMLAAAAVCAMAATPGQLPDAFLKARWETPVPAGEQRYFDGMLYLMSMMHLGGAFRVIDQAQP